MVTNTLIPSYSENLGVEIEIWSGSWLKSRESNYTERSFMKDLLSTSTMWNTEELEKWSQSKEIFECSLNGKSG